MALINQSDLRRYAETGYNVLFEGKHGVGKTAIIQSTFEAMGYKWLYFSAATLDPWVDLIGVPKAKETKRGEELTLVRPSFVLDDNIDAIFFDELNRAPDKVLNAVMELIQFKSINGHKLKRLKVIWAAVNPWDEENTYAVNEMDPAFKDRFQIQIPVPYKVDEDWFAAKYPETGKVFCGWWKSLDADAKNLVSPRRLDYAADAHAKQLKMTDIIPATVAIKKLKDDLASIPFMKKIEQLKTDAAIKTFLSSINNVTELLDLVREQNPVAVKFLDKHKHHVPKEIVAAALPDLPAGKAKKLNHELTEHAFEQLLRGTLDDGKFVFDVEATALFKVEQLYQIELLSNPKFNFLPVLVDELKLYKSGSKASQARVHKLTGLAVEYLGKVTHEHFNKHDRALMGLLAAVIIVDHGEQFTKPRAEFLAGKLKRDPTGGINCIGIADLLTNSDATGIVGC
jgi:MoxR-like ATPase